MEKDEGLKAVPDAQLAMQFQERKRTKGREDQRIGTDEGGK